MATSQIIQNILEDDDRSPIEVDADNEELEDVDIEVVDDTPEEDRGRKPPEKTEDDDHETEEKEEELKSYSENVQKRIKKLRWEYHEERRAKEAAERQNEEAVRIAQRLKEENDKLRKTVTRSDTALLDQAKQRAEVQLAQAKAEYKRAYEEGDAEAVVSAQEALSRAVADLQRLDTSSYQDDDVDDVDTTTQQQQQQERKPDPKAQAWLKENPWFGQDEEMTGYAYGLHERLIKRDRIDPTSDEYYKVLNETMRKRFPDKFKEYEEDDMDFEEEDSEAKEKPKKKTVVASAQRTGGKARTIRLTATQVALARRLGLTPEQYAQELVKGNYE